MGIRREKLWRRIGIALLVVATGSLAIDTQVFTATLTSPDSVAQAETERQRAARLNIEGARLFRAGRLSEAESLFQEAMAIDRRTLGADHPDTARSQRNLVVIYRQLGKDAEAEALLNRS